jgi:hypothetical protein
MSNNLWIVFWSFLGGIIGLLFDQVQKRIINNFSQNNSKKLLDVSFMMTYFKLLFIFLILILSFRQSLEAGFGFLVFFLIAKWIGIIRFVKSNK